MLHNQFLKNTTVRAFRQWLIPVLLLVSGGTLFAQQKPIKTTQEKQVAGNVLEEVSAKGPKIYYFPIDRMRLLRDFQTNRIMLESLDVLLSNKKILANIDSIIITSAASPVGNVRENDSLSIGRALSLKRYISWEHPIDRDKIYTYPVGIDWIGFWTIVENTPNMPSRAKILALKKVKNEEQLLKLLVTIGGPETYRYLLNEVYPKLQYASVRVVLRNGQSIPAVGSPIKQIVEPESARDTIWRERVVRVRDTVVVRDTISIERLAPPYRRPFYLAIKNNLLYDLALLPNLAVEIPFGWDYRWSIEVQGNWSWWSTGAPNYRFHRIQMAGLEMRYWFGNWAGDPLQGFFVGAYGYGGTYDIRLFSKKNSDLGQLSDKSWSAGLSVGYAMPISRRFSLEFGLGLGYIGGQYHKYYRSDCADEYPKVSIHDRNYFGPTKANISIVWLIGSGVNSNYKFKKKDRW